MIITEVERVIADLKRATSYTMDGQVTAADLILERVTDDVCRIIALIERSQKGKLYDSIYGVDDERRG